jgi:hypothetical protein
LRGLAHAHLISQDAALVDGLLLQNQFSSGIQPLASRQAFNTVRAQCNDSVTTV